MSNAREESSTTTRIKDHFPIGHIQAFGAGTVGPIYVTFDDNEKIVLAEAELYDATFKRMIIDDPNTLRIFGDRGEKIDMDVLHPWPKFRLDPLGPISIDDTGVNEFEVGRLTDITRQPASARFGTPFHNLATIDPSGKGEVYRSIQKTFGGEAKKVGAHGKSHPPQGFRLSDPALPLNSIADQKVPGYAAGRVSGRIAAKRLLREDSAATDKLSLVVEPSQPQAGPFLQTLGKPSVPRPILGPSATNMVKNWVVSGGYMRPSQYAPEPVRGDMMTTDANLDATSLQGSGARKSDSTTQGSNISGRPVRKAPVPLPSHNISGSNSQPESDSDRRKRLRRLRNSNIVPKGLNREKVQKVVDEIFAILTDAATRQQYEHYVVFVRKEVAGDPVRKRLFHEELYNFVERHGIVEMHNQYAGLTRTGANAAYQLPIFSMNSQLADQQSNEGLELADTDPSQFGGAQHHDTKDSAGSEHNDRS